MYLSVSASLIRVFISAAAASVKVSTSTFRTSGQAAASATISTHRPESTAVLPVPAEAVTSTSRPRWRMALSWSGVHFGFLVAIGTPYCLKYGRLIHRLHKIVIIDMPIKAAQRHKLAPRTGAIALE